MAQDQAMEHNCFQKVTCMKANGSMISKVDLGNMILQEMPLMVEIITLENSKMVKEMEKESMFGKMVLFMKGSLWMVKVQAMGHICMQVVKSMKVSGSMTTTMD